MPLVVTTGKHSDPLNRVLDLHAKTSIEEAPKIDLKAMPTHFMYALLGEDKTLVVIMSTT